MTSPDDRMTPTAEPTPAPDGTLKPKTSRWPIVIVVALVAIIGIWIASSSHTTPSSSDLGRDAQRACEKTFIPNRLKAPATAQFTGVTVSESGGAYTVAGSVDSQNSFGALIRSTFTCVVHSSDDDAQWVLESASVS